MEELASSGPPGGGSVEEPGRSGSHGTHFKFFNLGAHSLLVEVLSLLVEILSLLVKEP